MLKVCISGPMSVGKTTVIQRLLENNFGFSALFENSEYCNRLFNSIYSREDSLFGRDLKQMLYLNDIIERQSKIDTEVVLMDKGIEDILFFWRRTIELHFPLDNEKSVFWTISELLRNHFSDLIFYLDASDITLYSRKAQDESRSRSFFDEYMKYYRAKEREHFINLDSIVISTDFLSPNDVAKKIGEEISKALSKNS
ncbi:MAG TPA: deoxynucleoside kinase [Sphaerochaeta sp.]|jgi:deoxyadenosine/deoxycytidine kinase|nr:deoxynucleoside kinase [Sphaerochaeta sp.]